MKFEEQFTTKIDYEIGVPVRTIYYQDIPLNHCYGIKIIDANRIEIEFEKMSIFKYFETLKEKDRFIRIFKKHLKEAFTYGK